MSDSWLVSFNIKIADCIVRINSAARFSLYEFREFLTDECEVFSVEINKSDLTIDSIINNDIYIGWTGTINLAILHQRVTEKLINYNTLLLHGAAVQLNNCALIFSGPSGVGKTTHIKKWLANIPDAHIINGDKPFVRFYNDRKQPLVYGSPWAGKEGMFSNTAAPLKAFICMERAEENNIQEITFTEAFLFLFQQTYRPVNEDKMRKTIELLQRLNGKVKFFRFQCNNFKDDCLDMSYNALAK